MNSHDSDPVCIVHTLAWFLNFYFIHLTCLFLHLDWCQITIFWIIFVIWWFWKWPRNWCFWGLLGIVFYVFGSLSCILVTTFFCCCFYRVIKIWITIFLPCFVRSCKFYKYWWGLCLRVFNIRYYTLLGFLIKYIH